MRQLNGFSPVCVLLWRINSAGYGKTLPQNSQVRALLAFVFSVCSDGVLDAPGGTTITPDGTEYAQLVAPPMKDTKMSLWLTPSFTTELL